jgi:protein TilB
MYRKLDMTLNFIDIEDLEDSIDNLTYCPEFNELYLTGNPCESWPGCKEYIIAKIKTIKRFDGDEITKSQRLAAL